MTAPRSIRVQRCLATLLVICAGFLLRRFGYDLGLSFFVVKYGGSVLWGAMVFLALATLTGSVNIGRLAFAAFLIALIVEFSRLYHPPELDAFRLTTAGKLLLGRVFSLWHIAAYAFGIGTAAFVEAWGLKRGRRSSV
ncbi:hypothetical protein ASF70_11880 [Rhizobium sp. Leaf321]|uniref:ribosomal maturation YjgA family protein n=1 Tax=Rhizobium sp. Leaf321 TaxID=1736335 RepID=UPI000713B0A1|nr:DUF2809 domain-containing protein [Rhizobium sp. Leaf321]KQQ72242.1 hypothetical protein ASF70_11880 [Rhizobium sp. Leaf321]